MFVVLTINISSNDKYLNQCLYVLNYLNLKLAIEKFILLPDFATPVMSYEKKCVITRHVPILILNHIIMNDFIYFKLIYSVHEYMCVSCTAKEEEHYLFVP